MKKTLMAVILITLAAKTIGFLREILLAYYYGATGVSDAYMISLTIPTVIFALIGTGIKTVFIPIYSSILSDQGKEAADAFTRKVLNLMIVISSVVSLVVLLFTRPLVTLFASGFEGETLSLAVTLTQISVFSVYFIGLEYVLQSYLQINGRIAITAIVSLPMNLFVILSFPLSYHFGFRFLAIGKIVAVASQVVFLIPSLKRCGLRISFDFRFKDHNMKRLMYLILPVVLGSSVNQINKLVDRTLASRIVIGGISALNYASRLNLFVKEVFILSITTILYPSISRLAANKEFESFKRSFSESITGVMFFVIPVSVATMTFSSEVVSLLYGRGSFDETASQLTSGVLLFYSLGMLPVGLREILSRVFYSLHDTKTPMKNAAIGLITNIILNFVLSYYMGLEGLALATSISASITMLLLALALRKKIGQFGIQKLLFSFLKLLLVSIIVCSICRVITEIILGVVGLELTMMISLILGAVLYFGMTYFAKIDDVDAVFKQIRKHLTARKSN